MALGISLVTRLASAQVYTGAQLDEAANRSLDVMRDHVAFLTTQDRYDASLAYFAFTHRFSPARVAINDGRTPRALVQRMGLMVGAGYGPPSKFGVFGGAWVDLAGPTYSLAEGAGNAPAANGLLFIGVGFRGFQLTYGSFRRQTVPDRDAFGNFHPPDTNTTDPGPGDPYSTVASKQEAFTVYHESGASLVVTRAKIPLTDSYRVTEVRAQLQPLRRWLEVKYGLPMAALQRLSTLQDYYGEFARDPARPPDAPSADLGSALPDTTAPYELELGSDDLLGEGIRLHVLNQISPSVKFRRAEAAFYRDVGHFTFGARANVYTRNDSVQASADSFAAYRIGHPKRGHVGVPVQFAISYSYNSPDGATFLPLPYAHVIGYQIIVGVPEIAKAIVPIVRAKVDEPAENRR